MVCKKCGFTQDADDIFCSNCGQKLNETETQETEIQEAQETTNENQTENNVLEGTGTTTENTVEELKIDVEAEIKQEIEQEIEAIINMDLTTDAPVIETLNNTVNETVNEIQTESLAAKIDLTKTEAIQNTENQNTEGTVPNAVPAQEPVKKDKSMKNLLIVLGCLVGILVIAVVVVIVMFFTKPTLGRAGLETQSQIKKELEAAKTGNTLATDIEKINEGSFTLSYNMDNVLLANQMLLGDAKNMTITGDYDSTTETFAYYLSGEVANQQLLMDLMSMTAPGYKDTYVKGVKESNNQLLTDIVAVFSSVATTKGVKVEDAKYDYEYKFNVDAYGLQNAIIAYGDRQTQLQNDFLSTLEITLQQINPEEAGKLYTAITGEPTNFMIDYFVQNYNTQTAQYNMYFAEYIKQYSAQYETEMNALISELDIKQGEYFEVVIKTTDGVITYVEFIDDIDKIVIEANDFTSYLQSSYTFHVEGENQTEPLNLTLNITPERWIIGANAGGAKVELDWDLVATEDNLALAVNDGYTDETVTGTLTGDYTNGVTLDMKDFGKLTFVPKVEAAK